QEDRASHSGEVTAGGRPVHSPAHRAKALHRYSQDDRLSRRNQHGVAAARTYGPRRRRCPRVTAPDLPDRGGSDTRPGRQHTHRQAPPSHASGPRSGHRTNARRPQRHGDGVPWHHTHSGLQTRISLTSPRTGGLNMPSADFCPAVRPPFDSLSRRGDTEQISWGKLSRLLCTAAESTLRTLDGYGLRGKLPARPALTPCIRFLSIDSHICYTLLSDPTSRREPLRSR